MKYPCDGERHAFLCARCFALLVKPRRVARALLCSTRHAAVRRGHLQLSANPWRAPQRIATQAFTVGARSRGGLMRTQWQHFWEHVSVHKNLKYPCGGECATDAPMAASSASLLQLACGARIRALLKPNQKHVIPNLERTTIAPSLYSTFTTDNAPAGRHAAMLLIHICAARLEMLLSHGLGNRRAAGSFHLLHVCSPRAGAQLRAALQCGAALRF